jgi:threonine/homoserine/homoserine lactone efflux protein
MGAMIPLHTYLIFLSVYTVAALTPGPVVMAISARALGSGFRAALPMILGASVGDFIVLTLSVLGLAIVAQAMGQFFLLVKLAGAAYLVWLGYKYWTAPVEEIVANEPTDARRGFFTQIALSVGNPKTIAFWVALVPTVVDPRSLGAVGYLQLAAACFTVTPLLMVLYAGLAARVRGFLSSVKARRRINKGAAVVMAGAGVGVAVS